MTKTTKTHTEGERDRDHEEIVTFHYNRTEGRASLIMHHSPIVVADQGRRRRFRVMVTGVPVARSAIIDLGSELELRSVRLHYQYDIHSVTLGAEPAHVIISYLLTADRRRQSDESGPPDRDPCFVNLFKFVGPLPPPHPILGTARVPPHTVARYIRIQTVFRPCVPFDPPPCNLKGSSPPTWRAVEIAADSLPTSPHGDDPSDHTIIRSPRPAAATRTEARAAPRAPAQSD